MSGAIGCLQSWIVHDAVGLEHAPDLSQHQDALDQQLGQRMRDPNLIPRIIQTRNQKRNDSRRVKDQAHHNQSHFGGRVIFCVFQNLYGAVEGRL